MHLLTAILFVVGLIVTCCALTIWQRPTLPADRDSDKKLKLEAHVRRQVLRENKLATEIHKLQRQLQKKSQTLREYQHYRKVSSPKGSVPSREETLNVNIAESERNEAPQDEGASSELPIPKFYKFLIRRKSRSSIENESESWSHLESTSPHNYSQNKKSREYDFERR